MIDLRDSGDLRDLEDLKGPGGKCHLEGIGQRKHRNNCCAILIVTCGHVIVE